MPKYAQKYAKRTFRRAPAVRRRTTVPFVRRPGPGIRRMPMRAGTMSRTRRQFTRYR